MKQHSKLGRVLITLFRSYDKHPDVIRARDNVGRNKIEDKARREFAEKYAKERLDEQLEAKTHLDDKAHALARMTGGVGVVTTIAAKLLVPAVANPDAAARQTDMTLFACGIGMLAFSLFCSLLAMRAVKLPTPPPLTNVINDLQAFSEDAVRELLPGAYLVSVEGLKVHCRSKAWWLNIGYLSLFIAMVLLLLSIAF